jgi:LytS/YehU family sensor histidine kinase
MFALLLVLLTLIYANNLLLIPGLLMRKKQLLYFPAIISLLLLYCFVTAFVIRHWYLNTPGLQLSKIIWFIFGKEQAVNIDELSGSAFFTTLITVLIFSLCWYAIDYRKRSRELKESQKAKDATELIFLKNQLNPNFLFNSLDNLRERSLQASESAPELILKLSAILRYLLYESNVPLVPFEKEREIIEAYFELELSRTEKASSFEIVLYNDQENCKVPPLLWLPVLENVFKYGIHFPASETLEFQCSIVENVMQVYSKNPYDQATITNHKNENSGAGLSNLRKRLALLYPEKHQINITQDSSYFIVNVEIQLA